MATLSDLFKKGIKNFQDCQRLQDRINKDQKRLSKLHNRHWKDLFFLPLVKELKPYFPNMEAEVLGPFGLGSHVSIMFKPKDFEEHSDWSKVKYITLAPVNLSNGEFGVIDMNSKSSCKKGSIGHANHLGKTISPLLKSMTVEEIAKLFK